MKSIHFFIITILLFSNINAQDKNEYKINWFNTENGLPSNGLKGLQWDYKTNFLWIATEAGIVRFNGIEFHPFTKQNTPYIATERTNFIVKNNLGEIYVSDSKGNLLSISNNKPSPYKSAPENSLLFTQNIYAISVSKTLFEEKIKTATESRFFLQFCTVTPLNDKTALILLGEKVYLSQFGEKNSYTPIDNTSEYKSIFKCNADIFSLGTNNIFYKYDTISKSFSKYSLKKDKLNTDYQDIVNGRIHWTNGMEYPIVINKNKAWTLNFNNNSIEATLICSAIPTGSLVKYVQYIKEKDLLFLGTDSKGLLMISKNTLQQIKINKPSKDESNAYYSQVYLGNGSILTNEGTIINVNKKTNNQASPIKGKFNYTTYLTEDSILWYAQYLQNSNNTILHSYNYKTKEAKHFKNITIEEGFGIAKKNDKYYIGTRKGFGIISGDSIRFLTKMSAVKYITNNPFKMGFVNENEIAIASCNGLALVNTQSGKYEYILSLPDYCIRTFWKYQDYLFIGTYGKGYFIYKKGSAKAMPLDKNNYLLYTHCFIEDKNGFCWISTNRGLFKARLTDIINYYEGLSNSIYYHYYGANDGMTTTEMNGGCTPCAIEIQNNMLSFPTMDGLVIINPKEAKTIFPEGDIYIDEITSQGKPIEFLTKNNDLNSNVKELQFKLGYSAWCNSENINLSYQLNDGTPWINLEAKNNGQITISNLVPGAYTLRIRKMDGFGVSNFTYKTIQFNIEIPWYSSWWFYLLCAGFIYTLSNIYINYSNRKFIQRQEELKLLVNQKTQELKEQNEILEKNNDIKTRLISIISHDIITPLKFLSVAGKKLLNNSNKMSDSLKTETITEMTNTAGELQELSTNILNWIKYQNKNRRMKTEEFNLSEVVEQAFTLFAPIAKNKNIELKNEVDAAINLRQYSEPLRILIHNLLTNSFNFSEKGTISISAEQFDNTTTIIVKDQGVGMTPQQLNNILGENFIISSENVDNKKGNGLGYLIIKDLVKMIGGSIKINSQRNIGTTVSISFLTNL